MPRKRKGPSRLSRCEAFAMRFRPEVKYLADIAARQDRRSLTSFVDGAIETAVRNSSVLKRFDNDYVKMYCSLWDIDPDKRLDKLKQHCPDLLSYGEQVYLSNQTKEQDDGTNDRQKADLPPAIVRSDGR